MDNHFDFSHEVNRKGIGNMKLNMTDRFYNLSGTEFDFATVPVIRQAVTKLAKNGLFGYTVRDKQYEQAVLNWLKDQHNLVIPNEWLVVTAGTIHSLATCIELFVKSDERIITMTPGYNRYDQAADRLGRATVSVPLTEDARNRSYSIDFEKLEQAFKIAANKLFVLCNPHSPTGQVWSAADLHKIAALSSKYGVYVFSDEIYSENTYGQTKFFSYLQVEPDPEYTVVANSLGKCFSLTGLNHANIVIPGPNLRQQFIARRNAKHFGSIEPLAYVAVTSGYSAAGAEWLSQMNDYVAKNMALTRKMLAEISTDIIVYGGQGGFYLWIDWSRVIPAGMTLDQILDRASVALDSGDEYGAGYTNYTRINLATPWIYLSGALTLIQNVFKKIL